MMKDSLLIMNRYKGLLFNLISKDITIKYRRSILGVLWSVLNPLLMMVVMTIVFSQMFKMQIRKGDMEISFSLYYLTGSLIYNFISEATNLSMFSILSAGPLIKKVYVPKYVFPLEKCLFAFVNMLFMLIAVVIVFAFMVLTGKAQLYFTMLLFPIPLIYALIFSIGFSLILSAITPFFRDMLHLYGVFLMAWMYCTPIIYPDALVTGSYRLIFTLNPMYYFINYFRNITLYGKLPTLMDNVYCIGFGLVFLLLGVIIFRANQNKFVLNV